MSTALFVFAHQDDEVMMAPRIDFERLRGADVYCVYLTDGGARARPGARDRESVRALARLGIESGRILFLGSRRPIRAGELVSRLDVALEDLEGWMSGVDAGPVYCPAWEGGNPDHDAAQLVAAAFAQRRGALDRCAELPLYHGFGTIGPMFRTMSPLPPRDAWATRRFSSRDGMRYVALPFCFPSQWRTWLGLFPSSFLRLAVVRREVIRPVDVTRYGARPHAGELFYERRFRYPWSRFADATGSFVARHFESGGSSRAVLS